MSAVLLWLLPLDWDCICSVFDSLISVENSDAGGVIVEGIGDMTGICLLQMVVVSLTGLFLRSGYMERMIEGLNVGVGQSRGRAELAIERVISNDEQASASLLCGCAIAAGTGMACGLTYLKGGRIKPLTLTIQNMASSITGMICDGGNHGCTMKGVVAVDATYRSVELALESIAIEHKLNQVSS